MNRIQQNQLRNQMIRILVPKIWPNNQQYSGEWKNGILSGKGTMIWPDKSISTGSWKNGLQDGEGCEIHQDNNAICGVFEKGEIIEKN